MLLLIVLFLKKKTLLLLRLLSKMMLLLELLLKKLLLRLNTKSNDLVSMLQKQISLEFLVVMLGYSIDNLLIVSWYMLVEE